MSATTRKSAELDGTVQPKSRLRLSSERTGITIALQHAADLAAAQKRALHATIHESTAPTKAIAAAAGISHQFLCSAALVSTCDNLPMARLPLVLASADDLTLLRFLAALQHADVVRVPQVAAIDDIRRASATMRAFAEFMDGAAAALEDAVVTPDEGARIEREGAEAARAIYALMAYYRARVQRPLLEAL